MPHLDESGLNALLKFRTGKVNIKPPVPQSPISKSALAATTVEPLDRAVIDGYAYTIRLSPKSMAARPTINITLREYDSKGIERIILKVPADMPKNYTPGWVDKVASHIVGCYSLPPMFSKEFLPDYDTLRRLIATRIEFYLKGGSAQRNDN